MVKKKISPEEQEARKELDRVEFKHAILWGSFLYGCIGIVFIIVALVNPPVILGFVYFGVAVLAYTLIQTLLVTYKKDLSNTTKVILIILNCPVYLLYALSY